jgi:pimeloyl-[acyl-carrier protein] methyl ester esterase
VQTIYTGKNGTGRKHTTAQVQMPAVLRQKITCVFVHGWGMNSAVWQPMIAQLPDWLDVICIDLPGYGGMAEVRAEGLAAEVELLAAISQKPTLWVGWSMGGLAVLRLAQLYPERVAGIFMVASNPCFVRRPDWATGVDSSVFTDFAAELSKDIEATLRRFLALQVIGDKHALKTVRALQHAMDARGQASAQALQSGLQQLQECDLRRDLALLECSLHWHLGGRDTLVPVALAESLKTLNAGIEISIEADAGHAPFLSHPDSFRRELIDFAGRIRPTLV